MGPRVVGIALVLVSAVCFSTKAIFAKLAFGYGADARTVLDVRMACALPFFAASAVGAEHRASVRLSGRDALHIAAIGSAYYLAASLDFLGLRHISANLERVVLFLYPTLVIAMNWLFYRERPPRGIGLALALSYGGVAVSATSLRGGAGHHDVGLGVLLVFGSALAYALYLSGSQPLIARYGSTRVTAHVLVIACGWVLAEFALLAAPGALALPWQVFALAAATGIVATVVPAFALTAGIARIGASRASVLGSVGPVATLVLSALALGEPIGALDVLGCGMVLAGVAHISRTPRTRAPS